MNFKIFKENGERGDEQAKRRLSREQKIVCKCYLREFEYVSCTHSYILLFDTNSIYVLSIRDFSILIVNERTNANWFCFIAHSHRKFSLLQQNKWHKMTTNESIGNAKNEKKALKIKKKKNVVRSASHFSKTRCKWVLTRNSPFRNERLSHWRCRQKKETRSRKTVDEATEKT